MRKQRFLSLMRQDLVSFEKESFIFKGTKPLRHYGYSKRGCPAF
jgi:hypothetical protein